MLANANANGIACLQMQMGPVHASEKQKGLSGKRTIILE